MKWHVDDAKSILNLTRRNIRDSESDSESEWHDMTWSHLYENGIDSVMVLV
jgi:hypothetical protein